MAIAPSGWAGEAVPCVLGPVSPLLMYSLLGQQPQTRRDEMPGMLGSRAVRALRADRRATQPASSAGGGAAERCLFAQRSQRPPCPASRLSSSPGARFKPWLQSVRPLVFRAFWSSKRLPEKFAVDP